MSAVERRRGPKQDRLVLPNADIPAPAFSYTFFPDPQEARALAEFSAKDTARVIRRQTDLTSRLLHQLITTGQVEKAKEVVEILGGAEEAIDFVEQDWHRSLCAMTFDFVPESEVQRVINGFRELGFTRLSDTRTNLPRVQPDKSEEVERNKPTRAEIEDYVQRYNSQQVDRHADVPGSKGVRILDPRRGLQYVGLGDTGDYDWVDVSGTNGFVKKSHYVAIDPKTNIALLRPY